MKNSLVRRARKPILAEEWLAARWISMAYVLQEKYGTRPVNLHLSHYRVRMRESANAGQLEEDMTLWLAYALCLRKQPWKDEGEWERLQAECRIHVRKLLEGAKELVAELTLTATAPLVKG